MLRHKVQRVGQEAHRPKNRRQVAKRFPRPELFADMMRAAGFGRVSFRPMSGGIVALHSGWRL